MKSNCCTTCTNALPPNEAVQLCKAAEPYRMFFLEDPLSQEDLGYFRQIRQNCATPIAMGELFNSPQEWQPLITEVRVAGEPPETPDFKWTSNFAILHHSRTRLSSQAAFPEEFAPEDGNQIDGEGNGQDPKSRSRRSDSS